MSFLRLKSIELGYTLPKAALQKKHAKNFRIFVSGNNLFFLTKYKGVDPEHSASGYAPAYDDSQTPRSRSVTFSLNVQF